MKSLDCDVKWTFFLLRLSEMNPLPFIVDRIALFYEPKATSSEQLIAKSGNSNKMREK